MSKTLFGDLLVEFRMSRELSREALGKAAGVSGAWIGLIERNKKKPAAPLLERLTQALGLLEADRRRLYKAAGIGETGPGFSSGALATRADGDVRISDEICERVAKRYWALEVDVRSFDLVAEELKTEGFNAAPHVVKLAVNQWERQGWVQHRAWSPNELPPRDPDLERALLQLYHPLRHVLVTRLPQQRSNTTAKQWDDDVHRWLGHTASSVFLTLLRQKDRVAVGSGRGPHHCIAATAERIWRAYPPLGTVISLTGAMNVLPWNHDLSNPAMDADKIASFLEGRSQTENAPLLVKQRLLVPDKKLPEHLLPEKWKEPNSAFVPHIAVVGIGALAGGHRLLADDVLDTFEANVREQVGPVVQSLLQAAKTVEGLCGKGPTDEPVYSSVGDFCNYLFLVPPPKWAYEARMKRRRLMSELESALSALQKAIENYNALVVSPEPNQLLEVIQKGAVIAVAGGDYKIYAIREVLKWKGRPLVSILVTDNKTARWLCRLENQAV